MRLPPITKAGLTTDFVQMKAGEAIHVLQRHFEGRLVNGFGVYNEPLNQIAALQDARKFIRDALIAMNNTTWPTAQDYAEAGSRGDASSVATTQARALNNG